MKKYIFTALIMATVTLPMMSCSDDEGTAEQKDWTGTATYFSPTDAAAQSVYYKPAVGYVGDPMPFYDPVGKDFKVMYLQDFRPNQTGTYHPIWCVSTNDAASYTSMGELIPCGGLYEQDAALGTGSTVYNEADKTYYTFYTGHSYSSSTTGRGEAVMMATSTDFNTWQKSKTFMLCGDDYGYSSDDFRDPFVFEGDDGLFHMLVSTYSGSKGVLAEFTSADLKAWTHAGVFMTMMWDRFYECPDLFKMGDWWYLVYSEKHSAIRKVQYFKGRTLDELKACTKDDAGLWPDSHEGFLDSRGLYAGKTATDGTNRYLWGWCPTRTGNDNTEVGASPNEPEWGGNLVAHCVIQHEDGTLTLSEVPAVETLFANAADVKVMAQSDSGVSGSVESAFSMTGDSYVLFNRLGTMNKIEFTVKTASSTDKFGVSLVRGTDSEKYYTMIVNPESDDTRKVNFEEEGTAGQGFIEGIDGYVFPRPDDNTYNVRIYTDNSVCVMYINDVCCYTNRIYGTQKNCWSINCYGGSITVDGLKVFNED